MPEMLFADPAPARRRVVVAERGADAA